MAQNILLTSLSALETGLPLRYFSVQNESGAGYFDALLDAEAGIKAALSQHEIDEIIVIGGAGSYAEGDDMGPVVLSQGSNINSSDKSLLSTYGLLLHRIAQFAGGMTRNSDDEEDSMSAEIREKLIRFIRDFREGNTELKSDEPGRFFDELAQNDTVGENFWATLFEDCPELNDNAASCKQWVKRHLYEELEPSLKAELMSNNAGAFIRFILKTERSGSKT